MHSFLLPVGVARRTEPKLIRVEPLDRRLLLSGYLDSDFGSGGFVRSDWGDDEMGMAVVVQADGSILAAGTVWTASGNSDFGIVRYLADGTLDTSFGMGGRVTIDFGVSTPTFDELRGMALDSSGRIVVGGYSFMGTGTDFVVARLLPDGTLDSSFGSGGRTRSNFAASEQAQALVIQPDGKILLAGHVNNDFAVVRYTTSGVLDTTFGIGGLVRTAFSTSSDTATSIALQSDGAIVVAGYAQFSSNFDMAIARYLPDGTLDSSFDGDGMTTVHLGTNSDMAMAVLVAPDGRIYVGGRAGVDAAVLRYNPDGTRDESFGVAGAAMFDFGSTQDVINAMLLTSNDQLLMAGAVGASFSRDFALMRANSDGTVDTDFGVNGLVRTDIAGDTDEARAMAWYDASRVVVVGRALFDDGINFNDDFAVARYVVSEASNVPPVAVAGGPYVVDEGSFVQLSAAGSHDPDGMIVSYEWDFDYDGSDFDVDATGAAPTFSAAGLDGPTSRVVALRVTDDGGASHVVTTNVSVLNVAPTVSVSGTSLGVAWQEYSFSASVFDPAADDVSTLVWDFGDGTVVQTGPDALAMQHVYRAAGTYLVTVMAMDKDGGSSSSSFTVNVMAFLFDGTSLVVGGTAGDDDIRFKRQGGSLVLSMNGVSVGSFNVTGTITAYGGDGDDSIVVENKMPNPVHFLGGNGNDVLIGSDGDDTLDGGAGDDRLDGQGGNDLLLGRSGQDTLFGGFGDDTLDGGDDADWLEDTQGTNVFVSDASDTVVMTKSKKPK